MIDNQELEMHMEGLTPYESTLYAFYTRKAQETDCAIEAGNYIEEIEKLKRKLTPKDLTKYFTL